MSGRPVSPQEHHVVGQGDGAPATGPLARAPAAPMMGHAHHAMANMVEVPDLEPGVMMAMHHHMVRWVDLVLLGLGAWLLTSPFTLGYRSAALTWSDLIGGLLVIAF